MVSLVLHYRRIARLALDVLLGAVETDPATAHVPVERAEGPDALVAVIRRHAATGRRPVVGWSFYSASFPEVAAELARVRAGTAGLDALHVAGGPHASADPEGTLAAGFDLAAIGEGEATLPALLAAVAEGRAPGTVPGLAWREGDRVRTSGRAAPVDLDAVPPCAPRAGRIGPLEITRGCVWACRFCQTPFLFRARFRHRSLESVRRWVRFHARLDARDVRFLTPSALSWGSPGAGCDLEAIEALLATAREEAGPARRLFFGSFPSELRPEHVSERALALVRRYCDNDAVIVGAQSGSERLLAEMGRGHGVEDVRRAVALARDAGFTVSVDFVFGLPGETGDDRADTRALLRELADGGARVHAHAFMPLPGTPWEAAGPGRIDPETGALLDRLASRGRAHGQWKRQQRLGFSAGKGDPSESL
ncbi:TIGR04013 family B12-binding domain/radical SAM domain-containing protein [Anaeromyxobacter oryzae]|uniref:B12-binding domain-containing radical SAM protein n=1 Tax=Anaeromyxobacter oryzae TaxID=2918170 RepID=A0ABN6N2S4_9BACT|nr:TIGR04013 family B12-binding domain/radical SAM domain-containing protein [Anaeromyxobacter oryzae]BDG06277.1 B12-binding domain-containing radical SAM protein [Anaeromyxobacter oryzae]